jgi:hypothetical protein
MVNNIPDIVKRVPVHTKIIPGISLTVIVALFSPPSAPGVALFRVMYKSR